MLYPSGNIFFYTGRLFPFPCLVKQNLSLEKDLFMGTGLVAKRKSPVLQCSSPYRVDESIPTTNPCSFAAASNSSSMLACKTSAIETRPRCEESMENDRLIGWTASSLTSIIPSLSSILPKSQWIREGCSFEGISPSFLSWISSCPPPSKSSITATISSKLRSPSVTGEVFSGTGGAGGGGVNELTDTIWARQRGQLEWDFNQVSMHGTWKA